jgi:hypothetical protein
MVFQRFAKHFNAAKNFGVNLYNQAQRVGSAIDKGARVAKQAYGVIAPALRELGANTGGADRIADKAFTGYNQLRDRVSNTSQVAERTARRLAGFGV